MVRKAALIVAAIAALAAPAYAADQFDLICNGTVQQRYNGGFKAYEARYRIDLAAGRWCMADCEDPQPIQSVTAARITFLDDEGKSTNGITRWHFVSRATGQLEDYMARESIVPGSPGLYWSVKAACAVAPFSGMPAAKF